MQQRTLTELGWVDDLVRISLVAATYFVTAKLALFAAIPPGYATALWPPSGIAVAALLLLGNSVWPGIWLGAALVNVSVQSSLLAAGMMGTGNTLEGLLAAALIRRTLGADASFERGADVVVFLAIAAFSATVAATVAAVPLYVVHGLSGPELGWNWWTWWQGDAIGIVLVTPLVLGWCAEEQQEWSAKKMAEAAALVAATLATTYLVFSDIATPQARSPELSFLVLPPVIWAAIRFRRRELTTVIVLVCAMAIAFTIQARGPFSGQSLNTALLLLLAFMSTIAATGLVLGAVVGERGHAVAALNEALREMRRQAITDPLTGLYNRRFLQDYVTRELRRAARRDRSVTLLMIDLDHFKRVNDDFGHAAGDQVLKRVATLLGNQIRASDVACRFGGEEFVVVLPESTIESARSKAESIRLALERDAAALRGVTASIGVAIFPEHGTVAIELIKVADRALYEAKSSGRNRVVIGHERPVRLRGQAEEPSRTIPTPESAPSDGTEPKRGAVIRAIHRSKSA